jgi:regulatory protein YycI of two-component signal transduction system YycFG
MNTTQKILVVAFVLIGVLLIGIQQQQQHTTDPIDRIYTDWEVACENLYETLDRQNSIIGYTDPAFEKAVEEKRDIVITIERALEKEMNKRYPDPR